MVINTIIHRDSSELKVHRAANQKIYHYCTVAPKIFLRSCAPKLLKASDFLVNIISMLIFFQFLDPLTSEAMQCCNKNLHFHTDLETTSVLKKNPPQYHFWYCHNCWKTAKECQVLVRQRPFHLKLFGKASIGCFIVIVTCNHIPNKQVLVSQFCSI